MKIALRFMLVLSVVVSARDARAAARETPIRPETRVWITGSSNIRRFTCKARAVTGAIELRGVVPSPVLAGENTATQPSLNVSVDKLDCGIGLMNRHLNEALHGSDHPSIEFRLATYEIDLRAPVPLARIVGVVSIGGVQRSLATTASMHADTLGALHVRGSYVVHPTDFGIAPPRRFGGLLRVRDQVVVHFDVVLDPDCGATNEIGRELPVSLETNLELEGNHAPRS